MLSPTAWSDSAADLLGEIPVFRPGESLSWDVFQSQDSRVLNDVSAEPERANSETPIRSEIILPLGDYGIMNIGSTEAEVFDSTDISLARVLAANTEAAVSRADREQALNRQNERLERFVSIVSHELRNPLNVAMGRLKRAIETGDEADLRTVQQQHERMSSMIEDLLDLQTPLEGLKSPKIANKQKWTRRNSVTVFQRNHVISALSSG